MDLPAGAEAGPHQAGGIYGRRRPETRDTKLSQARISYLFLKYATPGLRYLTTRDAGGRAGWRSATPTPRRRRWPSRLRSGPRKRCRPRAETRRCALALNAPAHTRMRTRAHAHTHAGHAGTYAHGTLPRDGSRARVREWRWADSDSAAAVPRLTAKAAFLCLAPPARQVILVQNPDACPERGVAMATQARAPRCGLYGCGL